MRDHLDGLESQTRLLLETIDRLTAIDRLPESRRSRLRDTVRLEERRCSELIASARLTANALLSDLSDLVIDATGSDLAKAPAVDATDSPNPR